MSKSSESELTVLFKTHVLRIVTRMLSLKLQRVLGWRLSQQKVEGLLRLRARVGLNVRSRVSVRGSFGIV